MTDYDYGKHWAEEYDALFDDRDDTTAICWLVDDVAPGRRLIEFALGTGRLAIPLAKHGFAVSGIELSAAMIAKFRSKPESMGIEVLEGSMVDDRVDGVFDVVLLAFSSLYLLKDQVEQVRCFQNAADHLEPGGCFVLECFVPDHSRWTRDQNMSISHADEKLVDMQVGLHNRAEQTIFSQHLLFTEEGTRLRPTRYRYAWPSELDLMANLAGLQLEHRWADWHKGKFRSDSGSHVSVYRKG